MSKAFVLSITLLLLSSCSLRYSFNGGSVPAEAENFSVDYFVTQASLADPNYGQLLSESFRDLLQVQTPLALAERNGDIHYEGTVSRYDIFPVQASGDEVSTLNRLTIELKVRYFNRIEPEKDKEFTLSQFEDFDAATEFQTIEDDLVEAINEKLLQDMYDKTLGDW